MQSIDVEIWRPIPQLSEYEASSLGRIRRVRGKRWIKGDGVLTFNVSIQVHGVSYLWDELIVSAFMRRIDVKTEYIMHCNDDRHDCSITNLQICQLYDATKEWRDVVEWEGIYKVSDVGDIVRCYRKQVHSTVGQLSIRGQIMKPCPDEDGYLRIGLTCKGRKSKLYGVHRLVAEAFIPNPNNLPVVNHIDGDKQNNSVSNLEWCTVAQNNDHARRIGLIRPDSYKDNGQAIKERKSMKVICIETGQEYPSMIEAERQLGLWRGAVSESISKGKSSHGLHFERVI